MFADQLATQRRIKVRITSTKADETKTEHPLGSSSEIEMKRSTRFPIDEAQARVNFNFAEPKDLVLKIYLINGNELPEDLLCTLSTDIGEISSNIKFVRSFHHWDTTNDGPHSCFCLSPGQVEVELHVSSLLSKDKEPIRGSRNEDSSY